MQSRPPRRRCNGVVAHPKKFQAKEGFSLSKFIQKLTIPLTKKFASDPTTLNFHLKTVEQQKNTFP